MKRNIVITGANRGIGLALSQLYSKKGDHVYAVCRQKSYELNKIADIEVIAGIDITSDIDLQHMRQVLDEVKVDILINNAGILSEESIDASISSVSSNSFK